MPSVKYKIISDSPPVPFEGSFFNSDYIHPLKVNKAVEGLFSTFFLHSLWGAPAVVNIMGASVGEPIPRTLPTQSHTTSSCQHPFPLPSLTQTDGPWAYNDRPMRPNAGWKSESFPFPTPCSMTRQFSPQIAATASPQDRSGKGNICCISFLLYPMSAGICHPYARMPGF